MATFNSLKDSLNDSVATLNVIQQDTLSQKEDLATKQEKEAEMKRIQELQKQEIERKEKKNHKF